MEIKPFQHSVYDHLDGKDFVLALTSPRRSLILKELGFSFRVVGSNFPEDLDKASMAPRDYVLQTAIGKGKAVWDELSLKGETPYLILSADTVVECDGKIFEKPRSKEHQTEVLKFFRDSQIPQQVMTAVVLIRRDDAQACGYRMETMVEVSIEIMDSPENISDDFIARYVDTNEGASVAGGYQLLGMGALMVKEIRGDYRNVLGLPFRTTFKLIEKILIST
ncbi:hypothetical protein BABINDRAFT_38271 [Babjeviella inositovora NRRL Y-12698]|uniref:Maf-like protein n=1 Tax=Babjeviella inositovora NRRL Y-12698 TaxID=984486 RepID=A0A1E3QMW8_9ASCO|nr:uncharacterized protein BABINDRAFT_38271 [Babjeviella inositovora NRRL Y-12698]ODQ78980.1 hypothetical protein BABINDRAFT_38271 [Babjeviella inositovora NRRL Y-12698]